MILCRQDWELLQRRTYWARRWHALALFAATALALFSASFAPAQAEAQSQGQAFGLEISGNIRTRTDYIDHLTRVCLTQVRLGAGTSEIEHLLRQCLLNTKIFSEVTVTAARRHITVEVKERTTLIPIPYLQVDTGQSRKIGVIMLESNFLGMGKTVASGASLANQGVSFFGYYQDPSVLYSDWGGEALMDHTRENLIQYRRNTVVDSYAETTNGFLSGTGYRWNQFSLKGHVGFRERTYYRVDTFVPPNDHSFGFGNVVAEYSTKDFAFYCNQGLTLRLNVTQQAWRTDSMHLAGNADYLMNWENLVFSGHAVQIQISGGGVRGGGREDAYRLGGTRGLRGIETKSAWADHYDALALDYQIPLQTYQSGTLTSGLFNDRGLIRMRGPDDTIIHYDAFGIGAYFYLKEFTLPGLGLDLGYNREFQGLFANLTAGLSI